MQLKGHFSDKTSSVCDKLREAKQLSLFHQFINDNQSKDRSTAKDKLTKLDQITTKTVRENYPNTHKLATSGMCSKNINSQINK